MSKCMVAFIDWYHESMDGTPRRKVKSARYGDPHVHQILRVHPAHEGIDEKDVEKIIYSIVNKNYWVVSNAGFTRSRN